MRGLPYGYSRVSTYALWNELGNWYGVVVLMLVSESRCCGSSVCCFVLLVGLDRSVC